MNLNLFNINCNVLFLDYEKFCDEMRIYEKGSDNFKEQAVASLKILHQAILKAFDKNMIVNFFQEELKNEDEYKAFLKRNQDIYKPYIKVLSERNNYQIN